MLESVATEEVQADDSEPINHPIVNYYADEVENEMAACPCDDCDPCDYERAS